ncbi:hypothetical protein [Variovorax sp. RA8]|uniref:hypothetical protein n=1 Tax=Variovorax sp. (strain JCM 16519 / RA8) TaxID=662548 RepID=UPI000A5174F7|nr:hypothetical protein [Variovorax sp. RA8]VTU32092.1 hypothetical protein RA8CHR_04489 [Variovorax sp. RA8]
MNVAGIATKTLCTRLDDERTPPSIERVRGQRYWTGAEIRAQAWFLAEAYVITEEPRLISFVTTDLQEARRFLRRYGTAEWSRVYVRLRAPLSEGYGMLFEELDEVYSSADGTLMFHLANGLVVLERDLSADSSGGKAQEVFNRAFARGRSGSLVY